MRKADGQIDEQTLLEVSKQQPAEHIGKHAFPYKPNIGKYK